MWPENSEHGADRTKARINFNVKLAGFGNKLDMAVKEGSKMCSSKGLEIFPRIELFLKLTHCKDYLYYY